MRPQKKMRQTLEMLHKFEDGEGLPAIPEVCLCCMLFGARRMYGAECCMVCAAFRLLYTAWCAYYAARCTLHGVC